MTTIGVTYVGVCVIACRFWLSSVAGAWAVAVACAPTVTVPKAAPIRLVKNPGTGCLT